MADINVNDKSFWAGYFNQGPFGAFGDRRVDYAAIVSANDAIYSRAAGTDHLDRVDANFRKIAGEINPEEIIAFLNTDFSLEATTATGLHRINLVNIQNRLRGYQAKKSKELQALEASNGGAQTARSASRWAGINPDQLTTIANGIKAIAFASGAVLPRSLDDSLILFGAALLVATDDRTALFHLVDPNIRAIPVLLNASPLTVIAAQVVIAAADSPSLGDKINAQLKSHIDSYSEYFRAQAEADFEAGLDPRQREAAREFREGYIRGVMSDIEDFVIRVITDRTSPRILEIAHHGRLFFTPNLGLSLDSSDGITRPIQENQIINLDGLNFPIGEVYPRLARETGISPFSGEHVVPRNLISREIDEIRTSVQRYRMRDGSGMESPTTYKIPFFWGNTQIGFMNYERAGFTIGGHTPYDGPTITVVSKYGEVYKINKGDVGLLRLSNGDVIQFGDNQPIYLAILGYETSRATRIEIPAPSNIIEQHMQYDPVKGKVRVKPSTPRHVHTYDEHGRAYELTSQSLSRIADMRNDLIELLKDNTNRKRLKVLSLKPEDLINQTPQEMKRRVHVACKIADEAFLDSLWKRIFGYSEHNISMASRDLTSLIDRYIHLPVENLVKGPTQISAPSHRPTKVYVEAEPTTPETPAAPARTSNSLIGLMMGLKIMFASPDMENVANAVTLPQHSIELSAAATQEKVDSRDSHDSNARRIAERSTAIARSRLAARARAARAVIRG